MKRIFKLSLTTGIVVVLAGVLSVGTAFAWHYGINIKPFSDPNNINVKSKGSVPVGIYNNYNWSVEVIQIGTLEFCAQAFAGSLDCTGTVGIPTTDSSVDLDGDGDLDLQVHFIPLDRWGDVFPAGTTRACVTGSLNTGEKLTGPGLAPLCDAIVLHGD